MTGLTLPSLDPAAGTASASVTVAAVPAYHPYVRRITAADVRVLADPRVPGAPVGTWWPPVILDPAWIGAHAGDAELLHIHFGTESFPAGHLTRCIEAAHAVGWPVVFTVHDLENPQLHGQGHHRAQLDELVGGADALVTLTPGAADVIRARWGREALVVPHPSMVGADDAAPHVRPSEELRLGVHLKDLRPNVDAAGTVAALLDAVRELNARGRPAIAEVRMHHRVRDEAAAAEVRALCAASPHAFLLEHERLTDPQLQIALSRLDACVLPYRFGTHSGWLELCWDLGVPVAAPAVGFYAQQHPAPDVIGFDARSPEGASASLTAALGALIDAPDATRSGTPRRDTQVTARRDIRRQTDAAAARAHADLYRRLLAGRAA